ncbi:MAG TPA: hypothetical protein DDW67_10260 [Elusimicrobia bacterium]|nr:hypothetical protein [Elusimicrobiota bacterium]
MRYETLSCATAIAAAFFLAVPTAPRAQEKPGGLTLLEPEHRAVLANNDPDGSRLYVRGAKARIPLIDVVISTPTARGGEVFTYDLKQLEALPRPLSHRHEVTVI